MASQQEEQQDGCDGCGEPLTGPSHKCSVCEDFELCEKCVSSNFESDSHLAAHPTTLKTSRSDRDRGWSFTKGAGAQNKNPRGAFIARR